MFFIMTVLAHISTFFSLVSPLASLAFRGTRSKPLFFPGSFLLLPFLLSLFFVRHIVYVHLKPPLLPVAAQEWSRGASPSAQVSSSLVYHSTVHTAGVVNFDSMSEQNTGGNIAQQRRRAVVESDSSQEGEEEPGERRRTREIERSQAGLDLTSSSYIEGNELLSAVSETKEESNTHMVSDQESKDAWKDEGSASLDRGERGFQDQEKEKRAMHYERMGRVRMMVKTMVASGSKGRQEEEEKTKKAGKYRTPLRGGKRLGRLRAKTKEYQEEADEKNKEELEGEEKRTKEEEKRAEERTFSHPLSGFYETKVSASSVGGGESQLRNPQEKDHKVGELQHEDKTDLGLQRRFVSEWRQEENNESSSTDNDRKIVVCSSPLSDRSSPSPCCREEKRDFTSRRSSHNSLSPFPRAVEIPVRTYSLSYRTFLTGRVYVRLPVSALLKNSWEDSTWKGREEDDKEEIQGKKQERRRVGLDRDGSVGEEMKKRQGVREEDGSDDAGIFRERRKRRTNAESREKEEEADGATADAAGREGGGLLRVGSNSAGEDDAVKKKKQSKTDKKKKKEEDEEEASSEYVSLKVEVKEFTLPREGVFLFRWNKPPTFVNYNLRLDVSSPGTYFLPLSKSLSDHNGSQQFVDCTYTSSVRLSPMTPAHGELTDVFRTDDGTSSSPPAVSCRCSVSYQDPTGTLAVPSLSPSSSSSSSIMSTFLASERLYYVMLASTIDEMAVYKQKVSTGSGEASMNVAMSLFFHGDKYLRIHPLLTQDEIVELDSTVDPGHNRNVHFFRIPSKSQLSSMPVRINTLSGALYDDDNVDAPTDTTGDHGYSHSIGESALPSSTRLTEFDAQANKTLTATTTTTTLMTSLLSSFPSSSSIGEGREQEGREGSNEKQKNTPKTYTEKRKKKEETSRNNLGSLNETPGRRGEGGIERGSELTQTPSSNCHSRENEMCEGNKKREKKDKKKGKIHREVRERKDKIDALFSQFFFTVPDIDVVDYIKSPSLSQQGTCSSSTPSDRQLSSHRSSLSSFLSSSSFTPSSFSSSVSSFFASRHRNTPTGRLGLRASPSFLFEWHQVVSLQTEENTSGSLLSFPFAVFSPSASPLCRNSSRRRRVPRVFSTFFRRMQRDLLCLSRLNLSEKERKINDRRYPGADTSDISAKTSRDKDGPSPHSSSSSSYPPERSFSSSSSIERGDASLLSLPPSIGPIACVRIQYGRPGNTSFSDSSSASSTSSNLFSPSASSLSSSILSSPPRNKSERLYGSRGRRKRFFQVPPKNRTSFLSDPATEITTNSLIDNCAFLPKNVTQALPEDIIMTAHPDKKTMSNIEQLTHTTPNDDGKTKKKRKSLSSLTPVNEVLSRYFDVKPLRRPPSDHLSKIKTKENGEEEENEGGLKSSRQEISREDTKVEDSIEWSVSVPVDQMPLSMRHAVSSITLTWRIVPLLLMEPQQLPQDVQRKTDISEEEREKRSKENRAEKEETFRKMDTSIVKGQREKERIDHPQLEKTSMWKMEVAREMKENMLGSAENTNKTKKKKLWLLSQGVEFDRPTAPGPWLFSFYMKQDYNETVLLPPAALSGELPEGSREIQNEQDKSILDDSPLSSLSSVARRKKRNERHTENELRASLSSSLSSSSSSSSSFFSDYFFSVNEVEQSDSSPLHVVLDESKSLKESSDLFSLVPFYIRRRSCKSTLLQEEQQRQQQVHSGHPPRSALQKSPFSPSETVSSSSVEKEERHLLEQLANRSLVFHSRDTLHPGGSSTAYADVKTCDKSFSSFLYRVIFFFSSLISSFFRPYSSSALVSDSLSYVQQEREKGTPEGEREDSHRSTHHTKNARDDAERKFLFPKPITTTCRSSSRLSCTSQDKLATGPMSPSSSDVYFCSIPILPFISPSLPFLRPSLLKELSFYLTTDANVSFSSSSSSPSSSAFFFPEILTELVLSPEDVSGGVSLAAQIDASEIWEMPGMQCQDEDWDFRMEEDGSVYNEEQREEKEEDGGSEGRKESSSVHYESVTSSVKRTNEATGEEQEGRKEEEEGIAFVEGGGRIRELSASSAVRNDENDEDDRTTFPFTSKNRESEHSPFSSSSSAPSPSLFSSSSIRISRSGEEEEEESRSSLDLDKNESFRPQVIFSSRSPRDYEEESPVLQNEERSSLFPGYATATTETKNTFMKEENNKRKKKRGEEEKENQRKGRRSVDISSTGIPISYFTVDMTIRQNAVPFHRSRRDGLSSFSLSSSSISSPLFFHHSWKLPFVCQRLQRTKTSEEGDKRSPERRLSSQPRDRGTKQEEGSEQREDGGGKEEKEEEGDVRASFSSSSGKGGRVERSEDRSFVYVASTSPTWNLYAGRYLASWRLVEHRRVILSRASLSNFKATQKFQGVLEDEKKKKKAEEKGSQKTGRRGGAFDNRKEKDRFLSSVLKALQDSESSTSRSSYRDVETENAMAKERDTIVSDEKIDDKEVRTVFRSIPTRKGEDDEEGELNNIKKKDETENDNTLPFRVYIDARLQADEGCEQTCHKGHCWPLSFVDGYRVNYCRCTLGYAGAACEKSVLPMWYIDFLVGILVLSNLAFLFVLRSSLRDFIEATAQEQQAQERKQLLLMQTKRKERYESLEEAEAHLRREEAYHPQGEEKEQDESEEGEQENGENEKEEEEKSLLMLAHVHEEIKFFRDMRWRAVLRIAIFGMAMCASAFYHLCFDGDRCFLLPPVIWQRLDCIFSYFSFAVVLIALMSFKSFFFELCIHIILFSVIFWAMTPTPRDVETVLYLFISLTSLLLCCFSMGIPRLWSVRRQEFLHLSSRSFKARRVVLRALAIYSLTEEETERERKRERNVMKVRDLSEVTRGENEEERGDGGRGGGREDLKSFTVCLQCPSHDTFEERRKNKEEGAQSSENTEEGEGRTRGRRRDTRKVQEQQHEEEEERSVCCAPLTCLKESTVVEGASYNSLKAHEESNTHVSSSSSSVPLSSSSSPSICPEIQESFSFCPSSFKGTVHGSVSSSSERRIPLPYSFSSSYQEDSHESLPLCDDALVSPRTLVHSSATSSSSSLFSCVYCPCPTSVVRRVLSFLHFLTTRLIPQMSRNFRRVFHSCLPHSCLHDGCLQSLSFRFNPGNRCFHCMRKSTSMLKKMGTEIRRYVSDFLLILGARICEYIERPIYLLLGLLLALIGVASYAIFETNDNYCFLHTLWHLTIETSPFFCLMSLKPSPCLQLIKELKNVSFSQTSLFPCGRDGGCLKKEKADHSSEADSRFRWCAGRGRNRGEDREKTENEEEEKKTVPLLSVVSDDQRGQQKEVGETKVESDERTEREDALCNLGENVMKEQNSGEVDPGEVRERDGKTGRQERERVEGRQTREEEEERGEREISGMTMKGCEEKGEHEQRKTSGVRPLEGKGEEERQQDGGKEREGTRDDGADKNDLGFLSGGEEGTERVFNEWEYVLSNLLGMLNNDVEELRFFCSKNGNKETGKLPSYDVLGRMTRHCLGENSSDGVGEEKKREVERVDHSQEEKKEVSGFELKKRSLFTSGRRRLRLRSFSPYKIAGERDEEENNRNLNATEAEEKAEQPSGNSISLPVIVPPPASDTSYHLVDSVCTPDVPTEKRGFPWSNHVSAEDSYGASDTKAQYVSPLLSSSSTEKLILSGETYGDPRQRVVEAFATSSCSSSSSTSSNLSPSLGSVVHSENDICRLLSQLFISHSKFHRRSIQRRGVPDPDERSCPFNTLLLSPEEKKIERRRGSRCIWCMLKGCLSPIDIAILQHEILRLRCIRSLRNFRCFS
ncbi:transmembrane protein [Cystoisospora suis]|uniref:Transmembrane protein n=1 Tax=Cystoisospora suis TaxID=483139 RepID=A0A2C6L4D0_9APIC|nr:transmembrane protein [Cystoisospora suis]